MKISEKWNLRIAHIAEEMEEENEKEEKICV